MANRGPYEEMKAALDALRAADDNRKPLTYAPWVLGLMLVIFLGDRIRSLDTSDWLWIGLALVAMPFLGDFAKRALRKQKQQAENTMVELLNSGRGLAELNRLQTSSPRYRLVKLPDVVQRAVVHAAFSQERKDEERRMRQRKGEQVAATASAATSRG